MWRAWRHQVATCHALLCLEPHTQLRLQSTVAVVVGGAEAGEAAVASQVAVVAQEVQHLVHVVTVMEGGVMASGGVSSGGMASTQ